MHELAYAEGILAVALEVSEGRTVRRVRVQVGELHRVVPDSLQFCFQLAAQDTPAAEAQLDLAEVAARVRCARCGAESPGGAPPFQCRACEAFDVQIVAGEELQVDAVELDDGWRHRPGPDAAASEMAARARDHLREHAQADARRSS